MRAKNFPADINAIGDCLDFIEHTLQDMRNRRKAVLEAMLISEEVLVRLIEKAAPSGRLRIMIRRELGLCQVRISTAGDPFTRDDLKTSSDLDLDSEDMGSDTEDALRDILLKAYYNKIRYKNKGGVNTVSVTVGMPEQKMALTNALSFVLAIIAGCILAAVLPKSVHSGMVTYVLEPVTFLFLKALRLIAAPAIFFSIVAVVSKFANFSDPGRVSVKIFINYIWTSVAAVVIGLIMFRVFNPGREGILSTFARNAAVQQNTALADSMLQTVMEIVPDNIISPFLNVNTLQLMFLAILVGIALGMIGDYSAVLKKFFEACNALFLKIADIVVTVAPVVIFCATVLLLLSVGPGCLDSLLQMGLVFLGALAVMMAVYCIVIAFNGLNPFVFLKKYAGNMRTTFILNSSIAAIPQTISCCKNKLGISPKVYSFSIPFGATANMDGNAIYLMIAGLFLAKLCGVEVFGKDIVGMIIMVAVLSMGAPITPGSTILCLFALLSQMHVSIHAICLILGINAIFEMFTSMSNTLGDVSMTLSVAKSEGLMDKDVFYRKERNRA